MGAGGASVSIRFFMIIMASLLFLPILGYRVLDLMSSRRSVPATVADVYDAKKLDKWKAYRIQSTRFDLICSAVDFALILILTGTDIVIHVISSFEITHSMIITVPVAYVACIRLVAGLVDYYRQMVIKKNYGLTRISKKTFWVRKILGILLTIAWVAALSFILYVSYTQPVLQPDQKVLSITPYLYVALYAVMLIVQHLLIPYIREKREHPQPLKEGTLRERLFSLAEKVGYKGDIQIGQSAEKFTNAAYYTLFGNKIVIYEQALEMMDENTIVAVVLQEMGHAIHRDLPKRIMFSMISAAISIFTVWKATQTLFSAFASFDETVSIEYSLLTFLGIVTLYLFFGVKCYMTLKQVNDADEVAAIHGYGEDLIEALKIMARLDFEDLNPHPLKELLFDDYPSMNHRIRAIRAVETVY